MLSTAPLDPLAAPPPLPPLGEAPRGADGWLGQGAQRLVRFGWPLVVLNLIGTAAAIVAMGLAMAPWLAVRVLRDLTTSSSAPLDTPFDVLWPLAALPVFAVWFALACQMSLDVAGGRRPAAALRLPGLRTLLGVAGIIALFHAPWLLLDVVRDLLGPARLERFADGTFDLQAVVLNVVEAAVLGSGIALAPWFAVEGAWGRSPRWWRDGGPWRGAAGRSCSWSWR